MAKSNSQKQQQQQQQQSGGEGAADYALKVFGGVNDQRAVSENNNAIAMNAQGPAAGPATPSMNGGEGVVTSSFQSLFRRGGNLSKQQLQNNIKKQFKQLRGGQLQYSELNNSMAGPVPPVAGSHQMAPPVAGSHQESMLAIMKGGNAQEPGQNSFSNLEKAFAQKGGKLSKQQLQSFSQQLDKLQQQQHQQGGVGLNEIVVPLLLLYASQKYAQGKNTKKNTKPFSKSVRKSRRFLR